MKERAVWGVHWREGPGDWQLVGEEEIEEVCGGVQRNRSDGAGLYGMRHLSVHGVRDFIARAI